MKNQPRVILMARVNNRTSTCCILTLCCKNRCFNRYDWCVVNIFDVHMIQSILYWNVCHQNPWKYWDIILTHRCRATHTCISKSLVLIVLVDSGIHLIKFEQQFRCRKMPKFECVNEVVCTYCVQWDPYSHLLVYAVENWVCIITLPRNSTCG